MKCVMCDKESNDVLMEQVEIADCFFKRLMGLMGKPDLPDGNGLLLKKVKSVHTCFMRFVMVAIYLDQEYRVIAKEVIAPWKCGKIHKNAAHVLEVGISDGDKFYENMNLCVESRD